MPPFTLHFVYTMESSICTGGHYYALGTMERTLYGIQHVFASNGLLTNQCHSKAQLQLLCHMVDLVYDYFNGADLDEVEKSHIPDITTFQGLLNIISLIIIVDLQEVVNAIENLEPTFRSQRLQARQRAGQINLWLYKCCQLSVGQKNIDYMEGFYSIHFHNQLDAIFSCLDSLHPETDQKQETFMKDTLALFQYKPKIGKGFGWKGPIYDVQLVHAPKLCKYKKPFWISLSKSSFSKG